MSPDVFGHDFGTVVAHDQRLTYVFSLTNSSGKTLHLGHPEAMTPCCSAVGPVPDAVDAGKALEVPVEFRVGHDAGIRRLNFVVPTDNPDLPRFVLSVRANLIAALEVVPLSESGGRVSVGEPGTYDLRVTTRRVGGDGFCSPDRVQVVSPWTARFLGPAQERISDQGVAETVRDLRVEMLASLTPGRRSVEIVLGWGDGETRRHTVLWEIAPHIRATPSGLIVAAAEGSTTRSIMLLSTDRPFRILSVQGRALAGVVPLPASGSTRHVLPITIDPARPESAGTSDLLVTTDDPAQPTIPISIAILPVSPRNEP